ncbi:oxidoreductase, partial [Mycobacterium sp. ITM-2017-0098]
MAGLARVDVAPLNLLDSGSMDEFAGEYLASGRPPHALINNAGIMAGPLVRDARGYEAQFATNHLGHLQLMLRLVPALRSSHGAHIVNVSSGGHLLSDIRWDAPRYRG